MAHKNIDLEDVRFSSRPGTTIDNALRDATIEALLRECVVEVTHNGRRWRIDGKKAMDSVCSLQPVEEGDA